PKHIGDSLILTPTLAATRGRYPEAEIWVVVRAGCAGILAGCPQIDRIITVAAVGKRERTLRDLYHELRGRLQLAKPRFDYIFELGDGHRSRWIAACCRGRKYSVKPATPLGRF